MKKNIISKINLTLLISLLSILFTSSISFSETRETLKGCINNETGRFLATKRCNRNETQFSERSFSTEFAKIETTSNDLSSRVLVLETETDSNLDKIDINTSLIGQNSAKIDQANANILAIAENGSVNANNVRNNAINISTTTEAILENANSIIGNTTNLLVLSEQLKRIPSPSTIIHVANGRGDFSSIRKAVEYAKTTLPSNFHRILIKVAPGLYFETENIELSEYISIEGSGIGATELSSTTSNAITLAKNTTLKNLTISHTSENSLPTIIADSIVSDLIIENVKINTTAITGTVTGISLTNTSANLENIEINISGDTSTSGTGITMTGTGSSYAKDIKINISDIEALGISVSNSYNLNLKNSMISLNTINSASQTALQILDQDTIFRGSHLEIMVNGLDNLNGVLLNESINAEIKDLKAMINGTTNSAINVQNNGMLKIYNSKIMTEIDQPTLRVSNSSKIYVSNSELTGGDVNEANGEIVCFRSFDGEFLELSSKCL